TGHCGRRPLDAEQHEREGTVEAPGARDFLQEARAEVAGVVERGVRIDHRARRWRAARGGELRFPQLVGLDPLAQLLDPVAEEMTRIVAGDPKLASDVALAEILEEERRDRAALQLTKLAQHPLQQDPVFEGKLKRLVVLAADPLSIDRE